MWRWVKTVGNRIREAIWRSAISLSLQRGWLHDHVMNCWLYLPFSFVEPCLLATINRSSIILSQRWKPDFNA